MTPRLDWATHADHAELADVMFDAVRHGRSLYSEAQRAAWVPAPRSGDAWQSRLDRQAIIVARRANGIDGFMSIESNGYIDFAYIRPSAQGRGLFRRLFDRIEAQARDQGSIRLWVHASLMAQPAFAAVGFTVVERQTVEIDGIGFDRAEMEKMIQD